MPRVDTNHMLEEEKVKRAVKEALDDKAIADLGKQMSDLSNQVAAGFAASHQRADIANGKLNKHEQKFIALEGKSTYDKLTWLLVTTLVGTLVYFITK